VSPRARAKGRRAATRRRTSRRPARRARPRRRRSSARRALGPLLITLLVVVGIGFAVSRIDVDDAIREVTLPLRHDDIIRQQAREKGVDADLIAAVIYSESRFRDQTSHAGARGLMQITPETAEVIERLSGGETFVVDDLSNPDINIRYGTFYLRHLLDRYDGNEVAALAAYNAGMGHADRWGGADMEIEDITFPETAAYVEQVLEKRREYRKKYAKELGL
jgi:soluble lytic murein transglycosylase